MKTLEQLTKEYTSAFERLMTEYNINGFGIGNLKAHDIEYYKGLKEVCEQLAINTKEIEERIFEEVEY